MNTWMQQTGEKKTQDSSSSSSSLFLSPIPIDRFSSQSNIEISPRAIQVIYEKKKHRERPKMMMTNLFISMCFKRLGDWNTACMDKCLFKCGDWFERFIVWFLMARSRTHSVKSTGRSKGRTDGRKSIEFRSDFRYYLLQTLELLTVLRFRLWAIKKC